MMISTSTIETGAIKKGPDQITLTDRPYAKTKNVCINYRACGSEVILSYTSVGTYTFTVPDGVTRINYIMVGGGGGGGQSATDYNYCGDIRPWPPSRSFTVCCAPYAGGGGGGGQLVQGHFSAIGGAVITIQVGKGGAQNLSYPNCAKEGPCGETRYGPIRSGLNAVGQSGQPSIIKVVCSTVYNQIDIDTGTQGQRIIRARGGSGGKNANVGSYYKPWGYTISYWKSSGGCGGHSWFPKYRVDTRYSTFYKVSPDLDGQGLRCSCGIRCYVCVPFYLRDCPAYQFCPAKDNYRPWGMSRNCWTNITNDKCYPRLPETSLDREAWDCGPLTSPSGVSYCRYYYPGTDSRWKNIKYNPWIETFCGGALGSRSNTLANVDYRWTEAKCGGGGAGSFGFGGNYSRGFTNSNSLLVLKCGQCSWKRNCCRPTAAQNHIFTKARAYTGFQKLGYGYPYNISNRYDPAIANQAMPGSGVPIFINGSYITAKDLRWDITVSNCDVWPQGYTAGTGPVGSIVNIQGWGQGGAAGYRKRTDLDNEIKVRDNTCPNIPRYLCSPGVGGSADNPGKAGAVYISYQKRYNTSVYREIIEAYQHLNCQELTGLTAVPGPLYTPPAEFPGVNLSSNATKLLAKNFITTSTIQVFNNPYYRADLGPIPGTGKGDGSCNLPTYTRTVTEIVPQAGNSPLSMNNFYGKCFFKLPKINQPDPPPIPYKVTDLLPPASSRKVSLTITAWGGGGGGAGVVDFPITCAVVATQGFGGGGGGGGGWIQSKTLTDFAIAPNFTCLRVTIGGGGASYAGGIITNYNKTTKVYTLSGGTGCGSYGGCTYVTCYSGTIQPPNPTNTADRYGKYDYVRAYGGGGGTGMGFSPKYKVTYGSRGGGSLYPGGRQRYNSDGVNYCGGGGGGGGAGGAGQNGLEDEGAVCGGRGGYGVRTRILTGANSSEFVYVGGGGGGGGTVFIDSYRNNNRGGNRALGNGGLCASKYGGCGGTLRADLTAVKAIDGAANFGQGGGGGGSFVALEVYLVRDVYIPPQGKKNAGYTTPGAVVGAIGAASVGGTTSGAGFAIAAAIGYKFAASDSIKVTGGQLDTKWRRSTSVATISGGNGGSGGMLFSYPWCVTGVQCQSDKKFYTYNLCGGCVSYVSGGTAYHYFRYSSTIKGIRKKV